MVIVAMTMTMTMTIGVICPMVWPKKEFTDTKMIPFIHGTRNTYMLAGKRSTDFNWRVYVFQYKASIPCSNRQQINWFYALCSQAVRQSKAKQDMVNRSLYRTDWQHDIEINRHKSKQWEEKEESCIVGAFVRVHVHVCLCVCIQHVYNIYTKMKLTFIEKIEIKQRYTSNSIILLPSGNESLLPLHQSHT